MTSASIAVTAVGLPSEAEDGARLVLPASFALRDTLMQRGVRYVRMPYDWPAASKSQRWSSYERV